MEDIVKAADLVAYTAHYGQVDKAGRPYIEHPRTVASFVETDEEKAAALLHDVMEDTFLTEADLRPVFGDRITDALCLLTHDETEDYFSYVRRVREDPLAKAVKLADLRHNSDSSRLKEITKKDEQRLLKYEKARRILLGEED